MDRLVQSTVIKHSN